MIKREFFETVQPPYFLMDWTPELQNYSGEDVYFCMVAQQAGFEILVDHDMSKEIEHVGTYSFGYKDLGFGKLSDADKISKENFSMSDIAEHYDDLKAFAEQCDTIVEFGVRSIYPGSSTSAFLDGVQRKLISVDIQTPLGKGVAWEIAERRGVTWELRIRDSREVEIPEVDFIFIDSDHTREQVLAELNLHAASARKYIGFHDTADPQFADYANAISEWMDEHPEWELELHNDFCHGLSIYRRIN
jgi:hypothetical protein